MSNEAMKLVDDEGENQAVRMFLAFYGGACGVTTEQMRKHLNMAGFDGAWPEWANSHNGHLTKAGAQLWIRHLFNLEQPAPVQKAAIKTLEQLGYTYHGGEQWKPPLGERPAQQEPVGTVQTIHGVTIGYLETMQPVGTKLYTASQQRKPWVGLTDEEIERLWYPSASIAEPGTRRVAFGRAIEAKLKEKNT